ncbi:hypothetical protein [Sorangium sp. So ce117]|uniref:hypothetical protein n=1 Tax=Sorangium sp. So ce117 TaxID=3133277 RepID=UPI003F5ED377
MSEQVAAALTQQYWSESTSTTSMAPERDEAPRASISEGGPSGATAPSEPPRSTINQPRGDISCSVYAPLCAYQLHTGQLPNVSEILKKIGHRLGGNSDQAFKNLCGYGLTRGQAYSAGWGGTLAKATERGYPVAIGVTWSNRARSGNHWVYYVGEHGGKLYARDQQNNHHLITIDPASWTGSAEGGWSYKITNIGVGFPSQEAARDFLKS